MTRTHSKHVRLYVSGYDLSGTAMQVGDAFAALSGATSGSIDASVTPVSGMVALGVTAAVRRYTRWQLAFGTATTATFVCGLIRG